MRRQSMHRWPLHKFEITQCGEIKDKVLQGVRGLIHQQYV